MLTHLGGLIRLYDNKTVPTGIYGDRSQPFKNRHTMKHIPTLLLALLLATPVATAQTLTTYTATSAPGEWQSIAQTGTLLASVTGDYGTQTLALPFDFMFGQSDYPQGTTITVRADGFVVMRGSSGGHAALNYWNQSSSSIISPFPLKDGQLVGAESGCWWQLTTGDDGDPMLVIEWRGLHRYPSYPVTSAETDLDNFNYQLRLHASGDISAVYGHMQSGVPSDTLFNFILTDGATMMGSYMDQNSLRGTWDSVVACSSCSPGYRQGNNWVMFAANNLAGCPDSGTVVTWHRPQPPCPRPTAIAVSAIAHDTALLSWTPNEVDGSYVRIQWDTADFTPGTAGHHLQLYGGDTMHLIGLTPNHQHWLYMRSDCGADSSEWHGVQFTTPCAPLSHDELPLTEDFEDLAEGYTTLWGGCSGNTVYVKDMQIYEGRPNMALRGNNNGWFRLPPVENVRTTVLRFNGHGPFGGSGSSNVTVQVGVMDDPFDIGSLQVLQTFTVNQNSWQEYVVPMAAYTGPGNTVAVKWMAYNMFFLDDLTLEVYEGCLPVESVSASQVGQHTAQVGWTAFVPAGSYRVVWYPAGQEWLADSLTTAADSALLAGLAAGTDYVVGVRALCSDTAASELTTATFRTRCALPLPLTEDFEASLALPDCWGATSMTTTSSTGSYTPAVPEVVAGNAVKLSSQFTGNYHYERGILLLPFVDTAVNRLRLEFDYRVARFPQLMSLLVGVIPGDDDIDHFIPLDTIRPYDSLWRSYTVETGALPLSEGRLVMMQHSTGSHEYVPGYWRDLGYVDNVLLEVLPACDRPAVVRVSQITSSTAWVHWQDNNGVGTYRVDCAGTTHTVVGDTTLLLTGLQPASTYSVGVSRQCGAAWTASRTAAFTTACEPIAELPWHEDFEEWTEGMVDPCWLRHYGGLQGSTVGAASSTFVSSTVGGRNLCLKATNYSVDDRPYDAVAVLPEVGVPLAGKAIGFDVGAFYGNPSHIVLELGLMADAGDSASFQPLDTVPLTAEWSYYEHAFGPADSGRLALRMRVTASSERVYIDNMGLFVASGCHRPEALVVDTVTQHTVGLTVEDTLSTGHYRFYWVSASGAVDSLDADTTTVSIGGLTAGQYYRSYVAARCGSALSHIVGTEFMTDCDTLQRATFPYEEHFDQPTLSHCWSVLPANTSDARIDTLHHGATGRSFELSVTNYTAQAYAVMPPVDTLAGVDLTLWICRRWSGETALTVGIMADPQDTGTFTPVATLPTGPQWTEHQVELGPYSTLGHHVAFRAERVDTAMFFGGVYLDDVTLSPSLPCSRPDSVWVDSVGATAALLGLADDGRAGRYRVLVSSPAGSTTLFVNLDSTVDVNQIQLTGLAPATDYTVNVAAVCYDSSITFGVSTTLVTACAPLPLPYRQDFDQQALAEAPRCWQVLEGDVRVASVPMLGSRVLYAYIPDSLNRIEFATAQLAGGPDSLSVSFYVIASQGYIDSHYTHTPMDTRMQIFSSLADSLVLLYDDTVAYGSYSSAWQQVQADIPPLAPGSRLLFRFHRTAGSNRAMTLWMDELVVGTYIAPPSCDAIEQLWADSIGYTQATVGWTPQGDESRWEVYLRGEGTNQTFTTDSTILSFTTLAPGTRYAFLVRPLCNDTLTGPWSDTLWFTTTACRQVADVTVAAAGDSAVVSWRLTDAQSAWEIVYGTAGFTEGFGQTVLVSGPVLDSGATVSHMIGGLQPGETYDLYVRALCDEHLRSVWSMRQQFTMPTVGIEGVCPTALTLQPNPTSRYLVLGGLQVAEAVELYDACGRTCGRWTADGPTLTLDLEQLPVGVYLLCATAEGGRRTARVLKR